MTTTSSSQSDSTQTARTIEISQSMTVGRASLVMALMIALSRLTGFGRMILVSHLYGTNMQAAAFEAAFNIPDTITILIAGGALATGFVPVFTELISQGRQAEAQRTFRAMWTLLGCAFGLITLVLFALTYTPWGQFLAPVKFRGDAHYMQFFSHLLRILLVAQFFFVLGGLFTGTLNALRRFWYPALQPVVFNLGIIVFGIALPHFLGMGIESQAWGALVGAIVGSLLIQAPAVVRNGLSLRPLWDLNDAGVRRVLVSLLPIVFGLASGQIIALNLARFFALYLPNGELPTLGYANRLMQVPLDLLASGPAIALYPTLSLLASQGNRTEMQSQLTSTLRRSLLMTLLATALLASLRVPVIGLLLQHGAFDARATAHTAPVLACYALCIVGLGAQQLLARGFYAMGQTRPPIIAGIVSVLVFCALAFASLNLAPAAWSLALCAAIATSLLSVLMARALRQTWGGWDNGATIRVLVCGGAAAFAAFAASSAVVAVFTRAATIGKTADVFAIVSGSTVALGIFILVASLFHLPELDALTSRFRRKKKPHQENKQL